MELKENELVVVPGLGVGRVQALQEMKVGNNAVRVFPVDMGEGGGVFYVPEDRVDSQGLRAPMDAKTAATIIEVIVEQEAPKQRANWRSRQRRYEEMLASNQPRELAALIGELAAVRVEKKKKKQTLSFVERRLMQRAKDLLFGELAAVTDKTRAFFETSVQGALAAAS